MVGWMVFHIIIALITYAFFPKLTKAIPASLAAIIMTTIFEHALVRPVGYRTNCVSDLAEVGSKSTVLNAQRLCLHEIVITFYSYIIMNTSPTIFIGCWYFPRSCMG